MLTGEVVIRTLGRSEEPCRRLYFVLLAVAGV